MKIKPPAEYSDLIEINLDSYFDVIQPPSQAELAPLDPKYYYLTSGEAVWKAEYMRTVYRDYLKHARELYDKQPSFMAIAFIGDCKKQLRACGRFIRDLKLARGEAYFLETSWDDGILYCQRKDPRAVMKKRFLDKSDYTPTRKKQ